MTDVSLESMIALTGGADFWHTNAVPELDLPQIMVTDGPHGVRKQAGAADHIGLNDSLPATCFPPAVAQAATWNPELVEELGAALGRECRHHGVGILLGPGANLKRNPLCGRNFEYFAEDPILTGVLAGAFIRGVQSQGIGTSLKHFAANNQETDRMRRDSQVDERSLRELYLRGFGNAIREAQPWTVMCSYNKLNGVYASQNRFLLTEVLREEWGFEGFVVSDWGAVSDPVAALKAGLDLEMPANVEHDALLRDAVEDGRVSVDDIERSFSRVSEVLSRAATTLQEDAPTLDAEAHHALARRVAEQGIVLLENDGILPLSTASQVAVVGEFARTPRYQGAGSSRVNPTRVDTALEAIEMLLGRSVPFEPGFAIDDAHPVVESAHEDAVELAREAEVVLLFLGLGEDHESEGFDRTTLELPAEQLRLLESIIEVNANLVVVLSNGGTVLIPFAGRVRAVVETWLLGQAGAPAIIDALYGLVNPSGKLTETIPIRYADVPSALHFPGDTTGVRYGEGLFVGYRGYDAAESAVRYPFGHGLSYTEFEYTDLALSHMEGAIVVELDVTNTGERRGREVVQVYVGLPDSELVRATRELKGFTDIDLAPGEMKQVRITITVEDLGYWNVSKRSWEVESGRYEIAVGASSRDIRLSGAIDLPGTAPATELTLETTFSEALRFPGFLEAVSQIAPVGSEEQSTNDLRMLADIPLWSIGLLSGQKRAAVEELIANLNASSESAKAAG